MATKISLPTNRDRDLGFVMLFLSAVSYYVVPPLAHEFGVAAGKVVPISTPLGALLMLLGIASIFFSKKKISVKEKLVVVKDGFFSRPLNLRYEEIPTFKLTGFEDESKGGSQEVWTVHMIDGARQYLIDRRIGQQMASRSLAERLAKAVRGSLIENQDGKNFEFKVEELDLSFVERVDRYPEMLGHEVEEPSDKVVDYEKTPEGLKVSWCFFRSSLLFELFCVASFLVAAAFIPLPGGPDGQGFSLFQAEMAEGDYRYFIGIAVFTVVSLILLAGYRNTLELIVPKRVQSRTTVWGIPVRGGRISLDELEHIAVTVTSRGPDIQFISDRKILRERLPAINIARWLAWEFRNRLANLSPESTHVEQSVEMHSI
ncbi:MAG TPA: hypothetical protein EYO33_25630 [Phycisphaerales bacterium]|nr:hypothetical protein [Phycisphaerales bacterium]